MAKQELLSKLKDVHLPAEAGWWPLAIGWWLLILLTIIMLVALISNRYRYQRRHRFSRHALTLLQEINSHSNPNWLIELEVVLKRTALSYFPKKQIAKLNQQDWISFLLTTGDGIWSDTSLSALRDLVYQNPAKLKNIDKNSMIQQSRKWLQQLPNKVSHLNNGVQSV